MRRLLSEVFGSEEYEVTVFSTAKEALAAIDHLTTPYSQDAAHAAPWDAVICDLIMPELSGLQFIERLHEVGLQMPVILVTAHATIETAAEALKTGAFDYVTKPFNITEIKVITERAIHLRRLEMQHRALQEELRRSCSLGNMIGKSAKMQRVFDLIERVSKAPANVLITGESGTGKEMVARMIHQKSGRSSKPFVAINCSAIPGNLLESELFGHKKGAFTGAAEDRRGLFEEAAGGTIFLDEIGDMPMELQAKLLRVIQERKVKPVGDNKLRDIDVRIISATHKDLRKAIRAGEFREDLFYRLCVFPIDVPPLRERREDLVPLADHFLKKFSMGAKMPMKTLSKNALTKLLRLRWSGNVRELENTIERAVLLADGSVIEEKDIVIEGSSEADERMDAMFLQLPTLAKLEGEYIQYVLAKTSGKKEEAAGILGINRKTLYRKEKELGLS